jgi:ATP-dependent Clp protease ATP-binding subunit ClpA
VIQKKLIDVLALKLLEGELPEGATAKVDAKGGELVFEKAAKGKGKPPTPEKAAA